MTKIAVVTGAGTGIGRAVALALNKEGFAVVLAGRNEERLRQVVEQGGREIASSSMLAVRADVTDPASVRALFARTRERFGRLDLLFNNAGAAAAPVPL